MKKRLGVFCVMFGILLIPVLLLPPWEVQETTTLVWAHEDGRGARDVSARMVGDQWRFAWSPRTFGLQASASDPTHRPTVWKSVENQAVRPSWRKVGVELAIGAVLSLVLALAWPPTGKAT